MVRVDGGPRGPRHRRSTSTPVSSSTLASDSIEVRRVDLREDELPQAEFDLVHARLVLEHLTDRRQILDRLVATLRPGGWIVIEDYDWSCYGFEDEGPGFREIADAVMGFMATAGFERDYGRRVVSDMEAAGLTDIRGEGRARSDRLDISGVRFLSAVLRKPSRCSCDGRAAVGRGSRGRCRSDSTGTAGCSRR